MLRRILLVLSMLFIFALAVTPGMALAFDPTVCATATATQESGLQTYTIAATGYAQYAQVVEYPVVDPGNPVVVAGPVDFGPGATSWTFEHVAASDTRQYQVQVSSSGTSWRAFDVCVLTPQPLGVGLADFSVSRTGLAGWETTNEIDIAGFYVWRGTVTSHGQQLAFVPAQNPGSGQGSIYTYQDIGIAFQRRPAYWLEVETLGGVSVWFGPVQAD